MWAWVGAALALAGLFLAYAPLLIEFGVWQWQRPHYQFYPFVLGTVVALLGYRWYHADRRLEVAGGPLLTIILATLGWLLLLGAMWLRSPLLSAFSLIVVIAAGFREINRRWEVPYLWGIWALLLLVLPLPLNLDRQLISRLQLISSSLSSQVLDGAGILHLMEGNALFLADKNLFVDEACSGIVSILSIVAAAAIVGIWWNRSPFHVVLLAVSGIVWATALNVLRISSIAYFYDTFGLDWSSGTAHELLSLALFAVAFVALLFTDQLLLAWITPVSERWEHWAGSPMTYGAGIARLWDAMSGNPSSDELAEEPPSTRTVGTDPARINLSWMVASSGVAFLCLATMQWLWWPSSILAEEPERGAPEVAAALALDEASLPPNLVGGTLATHRTEERDTGHLFGQFSQVYEYLDAEARPVVVSCDFAFNGEWHELTVCYQGMGWEMQSREVVELEGQESGNSHAVQARFLRTDGQYAAVLFCEFDEIGTLLEPPTKTLSDNLATAFSRRSGKSHHGDVFQVQVLLISPNPLSDERLAQARKWLADARNQFGRHVTSPLASGNN